MLKTWILAAAIVMAGFLIGGRYIPATASGGQSGIYIVDRFTGAAWHCWPNCERVEYR
jgi:hypothetical protein